ncbi:MAG: ATP-binding protein [Chloroflexota bacterium]|nr:ATP-binding protein [Chloroflexota bacterium]
MRIRLILSFVIVVIISITVVVLVARQSTENEVRAFINHGGSVDADRLMDTLQDYYAGNDSWIGVEQILQSGGGQKGKGQGGQSSITGQQFRLADEEGNIIYDSTGSNPDGRLSRSEREEAVPITVNDNAIGFLLTEGGGAYNRSEERNLISRLNNAAVTAALIAGGISLLIAIFLAYRLLRPVRELTLAAERISGGDLSERVPIHGNDELATLAHTFNSMADSLQEAEESRRSMTADIAHELRNPLAVQRANLEAMQDGIYPLTPQNLEPVIEQNALLSRMVDDLRTLALADAGQLVLEYSQVDFLDLVNRMVERFAPQAVVDQITIGISTLQSTHKDEFNIWIDSVRMEQVIGNLLSNALRYTPAGGEVRLQLRSVDRGVILRIHDSGLGIPDEALPYVFDRFYRADRSRSREAGGTGLGLAIAYQLVKAHGGELDAANHPDGGAVFTVKLLRNPNDNK